MAGKEKNQKRRKTQQEARDRMALQRGEDPKKARKRRKKKKQRQKEPLGMSLSVFLGLLIIIFVLARGFSINGELLMTDVKELKGEATATVVQLEKKGVFGKGTNYPVFQFEAEGKTYTHTSLIPVGSKKTDRLPVFKKGDTELIRYDVADPKKAFSDTELTNKGSATTGYFAVAGIILAVLLMSVVAGRLTGRGQQVLRNKHFDI